MWRRRGHKGLGGCCFGGRDPGWGGDGLAWAGDGVHWRG